MSVGVAVGPRVGGWRRSINASFTPVNAETEAFIARMATAPSGPYPEALDAFFTAIKASPGLSHFDHVHVLALHDEASARLNLIGETLTLAHTAGDPDAVFTAGEGFTGVNDTGGLTLGATPSQLTKAVQTSASIVLVVEAAGSDPAAAIVTPETGTQRLLFNPRKANGVADARLNHFSTHSTTATTAAREGIWVATRNADTIFIYRNGVLVESAAYGSSAPSSQTAEVQLFRGYSSACDDQVSFWATGAHLSAVQAGAVTDAIDAYRVGIGLAPFL